METLLNLYADHWYLYSGVLSCIVFAALNRLSKRKFHDVAHAFTFIFLTVAFWPFAYLYEAVCRINGVKEKDDGKDK